MTAANADASHADGLARCPWPKDDPLYLAYHDEEWGVPGIRRPRALREARARRLSGRPVLDHHPAQAREFPPRLRRLCAGENRALPAEQNRAPDGGRRHRAQSRQDRRRGALGARLARDHGERPGLFQIVVGFRRRPAEGQPLSHHGSGAGGNRDLARDVQGTGAARLQILRADHRLRLHAGRRHGQRSSHYLPPP